MNIGFNYILLPLVLLRFSANLLQEMSSLLNRYVYPVS